MKRTVMMLMLMLLTTVVSAQSRQLNISKFMSNDQKRRTEGTKELYVSGKKLRRYDLTFYHSFMLLDKTKSASLAKIMEDAVRADGKKADDRQVMEIGGHLYYAIYTLDTNSDTGISRYIFYKDTSLKGDGNQVIVVYMEGTATIEEIKKKFK